ncbi:MAG: hypothetical protein WBB69_14330 [Anaerolineales bacterium]
MDEIGVAVKFMDDQGFARFAPIGGIPPVGLIGSRVRFTNGTIGVIYAFPVDTFTPLMKW